MTYLLKKNCYYFSIQTNWVDYIDSDYSLIQINWIGYTKGGPYEYSVAFNPKFIAQSMSLHIINSINFDT